MLQKLKSKLIIAATILAAMAPTTALTAGTAYAAVNQQDINNSLSCGSDVNLTPNATCKIDTSNAPTELEKKITKAINLFSVIVGIVAVVMVIYGGFRYVTSGGKQESVTNAKNTLLYAIIGLVIVALSQAIVHFVLKSTTTT
jgi:hypothetical protein